MRAAESEGGMFQKINSAGLWGIDGMLVSVEADVHDGLPGFIMTGNLSRETREAQERVRTALKNGGFRLGPKKITINLSPADIRKEGTTYDLAMAAAVLGAFGILEASCLRDGMVVGELGLNGEVKPVRGMLSLVSAAKEAGLKRCFLPKDNAMEGSAIQGMEIIPVESIQEFAHMLMNPGSIQGFFGQAWEDLEEKAWDAYDVDFTDLNGQAVLRRATEVAVAGRHNILYIGPAGSGKTMAARRIPTILPALSQEESLEISKIYSICGLLPKDTPLITRRPFRSPHHTITPTALTGGGAVPKPGEISLASGGVLFLDELPEFAAKSIEILRQPLEDRLVTVSRIYGSYVFPANVMVASAMNPCPCGFYPDRSRCRCSTRQIKQYIGRISKPILDRMDVTVEAAPVTYQEFRQHGRNESSAAIRSRVMEARRIQAARFAGGVAGTEGDSCSGNFGKEMEGKGSRKGRHVRFNGEMGVKEIEAFCRLQPEEESYLEQIYQKMNISVRGCHKILKVARTIADLAGEEEIHKAHLCEAVSYRSMEEKYWG